MTSITLLRGNLKMALGSLRSAKVHSFLTMFGIIVGVASVVTMVSLGEGFKQQVTKQISQSGPDVVTIRPGRIVSRDKSGKVRGLNVFSTLSGSTISEKELDTVTKTTGVKEAVPFSVVSGLPSIGGHEYQDFNILATTFLAPTILNHKVEYGSFFDDTEMTKHVVVLGRHTADTMFGELAPIGKKVTLRGQEFIVQGVFEEFKSINIGAGTNFNDTIFIPYDTAKEVTGVALPIYQILVRPNSPAMIDQMVMALGTGLKADHSGQEDFTILKSQENLALADNVLGLATKLIAGIAAISLLVGGVGIMNIMFALVTERTGEIGIRKAIGATNSQILGQFLIEATVLSLCGGVIGIVISLLTNIALRILTDLQPVINLPIIFIATGVSIAVGVLSGAIPAFRAARKDPIESLRYH